MQYVFKINTLVSSSIAFWIYTILVILKYSHAIYLILAYFTIKGTAIDVSGRRCEINSRNTDRASSTEMDNVIFSPPETGKRC